METKNFLLFCLIIELVQVVRYLNAVEKLNEKNVDDNNILIQNKITEASNAYQINDDDQFQIVAGVKANQIQKTDSVYRDCEIFLNRKNIKMELFKSYMITPLEFILYLLFMINIICSLGQYIYDNFDDPIVGLKAFVKECNDYWKGALFLSVILMYRIVSKKLEDLTYLQALKYKFGFGKNGEEKNDR